ASTRTKLTMASAMLQRSVAGGVTATRLLSGSTTASSRTRSGAPHSPGPDSGGSEGAIATSGVSRSRHADGGGASFTFGPGAGTTATTGAGRGRGIGTVSAAAGAQAVTSSVIAQMRFTRPMSTSIVALWG